MGRLVYKERLHAFFLFWKLIHRNTWLILTFPSTVPTALFIFEQCRWGRFFYSIRKKKELAMERSWRCPWEK